MIWWVMLASGLLTFAIRLSFIAAEGRFQPPHWFRRMLPFVPIAALTALIVPDLLLADGVVSLGLDNPRLYAGIIAILIAARWKNTLATIFFGFAALLVLQKLFG